MNKHQSSTTKNLSEKHFLNNFGSAQEKRTQNKFAKKVASKLEKIRNFPLIGFSGTKGGLSLGNRKGEFILGPVVNTPTPSL